MKWFDCRKCGSGSHAIPGTVRANRELCAHCFKESQRIKSGRNTEEQKLESWI